MTKPLIIILYTLLAMTGMATAQNTLPASLAGNWHFVAANEGEPDAYGIYHSSIVDVPFTATVTTDGQDLDCTANCLFKADDGTEYAARWQMVVEQNTEGQHRIGWVLTTAEPTFTTQYDGLYVYLLADKVGEEGFHGMTFWSAWTTAVSDTYTLSNTEYQARTIYAITSATSPYSTATGYIEAWSSPRIQRSAYPTAVTTIASAPQSQTPVCHDLQGRSLVSPQPGVYIKDGRKIIVR